MRYFTDTATRKESVRRAAVLACRGSRSSECELLENLSDREWGALQFWLDISGLSLYFFDCLNRNGCAHVLPSAVSAKLAQNLVDNLGRTRSMIEDLAEISDSFAKSHLYFAVLKGLSLCPLSVPHPWLRSQADLDFLIAEGDAPLARRLLENRGFHLHAISGRSWEFRAGRIHTATLENLYRAIPFRCVDLHLEAPGSSELSLLHRIETGCYEGFKFPVLPPTDLLAGQGAHLYKHICGEYFRASHVLEFHNHLAARKEGDPYWDELRSLYEGNTAMSAKLGVATLLTERVLGRASPPGYQSWTVDCLPTAARLWVEQYGDRATFADPPGSKLYLLLQEVLTPSGVPAERSALRALIPRRLPHIASGPPHEPLSDRLRRYRLKFRFICVRLSFHVIQGFRYMSESIAWSRELERHRATSALSKRSSPQQKSDNPLTHA